MEKSIDPFFLRINNTLTYYYNFVIVITILILPKIPIGDSADHVGQQGVLVGEILLIFSFFVNAKLIFKFFREKLLFDRLFFIFFFFLFIYVFLSSIISGSQNFIFPASAIFYFFRISIYFLLPFVFYQIFRVNKNVFSWYKIIKYSYLLHAIIAILVFFYYNRKYNPSVGEMIWTTELGYRLIPLMGTAFSPSNNDMFYAIGGGSGNLLGSWSLFFVLAVWFFEKKYTNRIFIYVFVLIVMLLSQSRGGVLTLMLFFCISFLLSRKINQATKLIIGLATISVGAAAFFLILTIENFDFFPILMRFQTSYSDGSLDASSADRMVNYYVVFSKWVQNPYYIIFGMGMDKKLLESITGWTIVESFYLSLLFCGGIFSIIIFIIFLIESWKRRLINVWYQILFLFLSLNSVFNWSVTGGDLLSVAGLYPIIGLITLGFLKRKDENLTNRQILSA